jgi:cytochrome P450
VSSPVLMNWSGSGSVKKGMRVTYMLYAMGRSETLWGSDWAEFKLERWLEKDEAENSQWNSMGRDAYTYPVLQARQRICLGKRWRSCK